MAGPLFNQNFPHLTDQAVFKGQPVDNGTLGPFAPINQGDKNPWRSAYAKQPDAPGFSKQQFADDAAQQSLAKIKSFGSQPSWDDKNNQDWSSSFLSKYTVDNGLIPQDQKVSQAGLEYIQRQQPAEINYPGTVAADKMKYPGASGIQV